MKGQGRAGAVLVALCALSSCADEGELRVALPPEPAQSYAGAVESTDAKIALVAEGGAVRAYVCGGDASYSTHTRWFTLERGQGQGPWRPVRGRAQGWSLEGEISEGEGRGVLISPEGVSQRWQAAAAPSPMGLYELEGDFGKIGAIVQGEGPQVQGALLGKAGFKAQVTPVRPLALPDNLWVGVRLGPEVQTFRLHPRR